MYQLEDQIFRMNQIIRLKEVMEYMCLGHSTLYKKTTS